MNLKIDAIKNFKIVSIIAIVLVAAGFVSIVGAPFGLNLFNLDIDFAGGTTMYYNMGQKVDADTIKGVEDAFKESTGVDVSSVQTTGDGTEIIVKAVSIDTEKREAFTKALKIGRASCRERVYVLV